MGAGGSIIEVSINGTPYANAADNGATLEIGGFSSETQMNGNGTRRKIMTRTPWKIDGLQLDMDMANDDMTTLQNDSDLKRDVAITIEYVDGTIIQATGGVEDKPVFDPQSSTAAVSLSGGGKATKQ